MYTFEKAWKSEPSMSTIGIWFLNAVVISITHRIRDKVFRPIGNPIRVPETFSQSTNFLFDEGLEVDLENYVMNKLVNR